MTLKIQPDVLSLIYPGSFSIPFGVCDPLQRIRCNTETQKWMSQRQNVRSNSSGLTPDLIAFRGLSQTITTVFKVISSCRREYICPTPGYITRYSCGETDPSFPHFLLNNQFSLQVRNHGHCSCQGKGLNSCSDIEAHGKTATGISQRERLGNHR